MAETYSLALWRERVLVSLTLLQCFEVAACKSVLLGFNACILINVTYLIINQCGSRMPIRFHHLDLFCGRLRHCLPHSQNSCIFWCEDVLTDLVYLYCKF